MLLTVLLLGVGAAAVVYNFVTPAKQSIERDRITAAALAQAKAALIGFALGVDVSPACGAGSNCPRIGDLPCPDLDDDGSADLGSCGNAAGTTGQSLRLGRLPWKTLGLPDLRDGDGERLWYAVSTNFKNNVRADCNDPGDPGCRNSDIRGTITVRDNSGAIVNDGTNPDPHTPSGVIAVIIAPGAVLQRSGAGAPQDRSPAGKNNPVNYLDIANVGGNEDNATFVDGTADGFINGVVLDASGNVIVNDRLIAIRHEDLMPLMERRVAKEVFNCLTAYAATPQNNGRYPWAAPATDVTTPYGDSNGVRFGRIPDAPLSESVLGLFSGFTLTLLPPIGFLDIGAILQGLCTATPFLCMGSSWPGAPSCNFSSGSWWMNWKEHVFYGVAAGFAPNVTINIIFVPPYISLIGVGPGSCVPNCLTVNPPSAVDDKKFVVIVDGKRLAVVAAGQPRSATANKQDAANYVEGENLSAGDVYEKRTAIPAFNDTVLYK